MHPNMGGKWVGKGEREALHVVFTDLSIALFQKFETCYNCENAECRVIFVPRVETWTLPDKCVAGTLSLKNVPDCIRIICGS